MKAVIFDMDGVVSDTETIYSETTSAFLKEKGIAISPNDLTKKFAGTGYPNTFAHLFKAYGVTDDVMEAAEEAVVRAEKAFHERTLQAIPGVVPLMKALHKQKIPMAIASGSKLRTINYILGKLKIKKNFEILTSAYEVEHGKPAPDVFLLAAKRLGVKPEACVVIEDGPAGVKGAKKAGMKTIGLVIYGNEKEFPADLIVNSLEEVTVEKMMQLWK